MSFIGNKKTIVQEIIDGLSRNTPKKCICDVHISSSEARALLKVVAPECQPYTREVWEVLKEEILLGRWVVMPYPLVVSDQGLIVDGQHRLYACAQADRPIVMDVLTGFPSRHASMLISKHSKEESVLITISGVKISKG